MKKSRNQEAKKPTGTRFVFLFSVFCFLLMLSGCSKQSTSTNNALAVVQAQLLIGETNLPANVNAWYTYRIQVMDLSHRPDSIVCEVHKPDGSALPSFGLYDDGGTLQLSSPAFASANSQDIAAHDGQFTRQINPYLMANAIRGNYEFHFVFYGNADYQMGNENRLTVNVQNAVACLLRSVPSDTAFPACFSLVALEVNVLPADSDRIDSVRVEAQTETSPGNWSFAAGAYFSASSGDSVWHYAITPSFFACVPQGNAVRLQYRAHTQFGVDCSSSVVLTTYGNDRPVLSDLILPDTAYRSPDTAHVTLVPIFVTLHDCEMLGSMVYDGRGDNAGVKFDVHRGTAPWGHDPNSFALQDSGSAPDSIGGDGIYSQYLVVQHSDSLFNNMYYFRFYAIDCGWPNDTSAFIYDSIRILQPEPNAIMRRVLKGDAIGAVLTR